MKKNIGISDRIIRFVGVDLLLGFSFLGQDIPPILATLAFVISAYVVLTIIFAYSPFYHLFSYSSRDEDMKPSQTDR